MTEHVDRVHEGNVLKCDPCGQEFIKREGLRLHIRKVHEII